MCGPWQELSDAAAAGVGCGHVSGLFVRLVRPLALMLCADRPGALVWQRRSNSRLQIARQIDPRRLRITGVEQYYDADPQAIAAVFAVGVAFGYLVRDGISRPARAREQHTFYYDDRPNRDPTLLPGWFGEHQNTRITPRSAVKRSRGGGPYGP